MSIFSRLKTRQGLRQLLYHCPTCNRRFKNQLERERHLLVHGPQRPFACQLCDHAATKMDALAAHVRKHLFLYMCCVCDGKFVSSQILKSHLKESHSELDQEQAFTDCINNSYYLIQPGGGMWGEEEREDTEAGGKEEHRIEQEGEDDRMTEDEGRNGVGREEWPAGEVEQLEAPVTEQGEQERKEDDAQGGSAQDVQVMDTETGKEEVKNGDLVQEAETTTSPDRHGEAEADTADSCTAVGRDEQNTETSSLTESIHSPSAKNTHQTPSSGSTNLNTPSSSAALSGEEGQTPLSVKVGQTIGLVSSISNIFL